MGKINQPYVTLNNGNAMPAIGYGVFRMTDPNECEEADFLIFNKVKPAVNMIECNAYFQRENERKYLEEQNITMQAWSPLSAGNSSLFTEPVLCKIADAHGKSVAQVVLRSLFQRGIVPVVKSANPVRMKENLDIFDFELTSAEMAEIAALDTGHSSFGARDTGEAVTTFLKAAQNFSV